MAADAHSTSTATAKGGGFPPFDTTTYPSQMVWLAITFAILFVVLWRIVGPRIGGAIAMRKDRVAGDLAQAEAHRKEAEAAQSAYETALTEARKRAHALAEENRNRIHGEIDAAKASAETDAQKAMTEAEARIQATHKDALARVAGAAEEATIAIVAHLTGETVSPAEARTALGTVN